MHYETKLTVLFKRSLYYLDTPEQIGKWLGRAELLDDVLKEGHYSKDYKFRVFDLPYPREREGYYKQGRVYVIVIRSSVREHLEKIAAALQKLHDDMWFELLSLSAIQFRSYRHITELITVTPTIVTVDSKPWLPGDGLELLVKRMNDNAEKKLAQLYPERAVRLEQSFVEGIQVLNQKPIAYSYKGRKLLGNKFRMMIRSDAESQKLAAVVMGAGVSEKNGILGAGFCLARSLE